ncbi:MAG: prepilin-type N-terminal cleavage/methylation domain-containing protein [Myxococcota bacterium]
MASFATRVRAGFTTIELLMGVVIVGIIATLAIPSFKGYVYRARVNEAVGMLNEIKSRQETYRAKYGQYAAVSGTGEWTTAAFNPATIPGKDAVPWPTTAEWEALGVTPPGPVRFQYATIAGGPQDAPPASSNMLEGDFWFAAQARGDLDGDGDEVTFEVYSQSSRMYNSAAGRGGYE